MAGSSFVEAPMPWAAGRAHDHRPLPMRQAADASSSISGHDLPPHPVLAGLPEPSAKPPLPIPRRINAGRTGCSWRNRACPDAAARPAGRVCYGSGQDFLADQTFHPPGLRSSAMPSFGALAPFRIRSYRFQWPADLLTSWAFEMETLILGWYVLVETNSVVMLTAVRRAALRRHADRADRRRLERPASATATCCPRCARSTRWSRRR